MRRLNTPMLCNVVEHSGMQTAMIAGFTGNTTQQANTPQINCTRCILQAGGQN
jgi:hypothetical protein